MVFGSNSRSGGSIQRFTLIYRLLTFHLLRPPPHPLINPRLTDESERFFHTPFYDVRPGNRLSPGSREVADPSTAVDWYSARKYSLRSTDTDKPSNSIILVPAHHRLISKYISTIYLQNTIIRNATHRTTQK